MTEHPQSARVGAKTQRFRQDRARAKRRSVESLGLRTHFLPSAQQGRRFFFIFDCAPDSDPPVNARSVN
jgi:hypothetical protein